MFSSLEEVFEILVYNLYFWTDLPIFSEGVLLRVGARCSPDLTTRVLIYNLELVLSNDNNPGSLACSSESRLSNYFTTELSLEFVW